MRFIMVLCFMTVGILAGSPRYVLLIGAPGTGKGALAAKLSKTEGLPVITTSTVLRNLPESDPDKAEIMRMMDAGDLVPDAMIYKAMRAELAKSDYAHGAIFDGFPRSKKQIAFLKDHDIRIDFAVILYARDDVLVQRLSGRRVHASSGRVYHIDSMPPKVPGKDDITGEMLVQRKDDQEWIIRKRLVSYREETEPVAVWAIFNQAVQRDTVDHVVLVNAGGHFDHTWSSMCAKLAIESVHLRGCSVA